MSDRSKHNRDKNISTNSRRKLWKKAHGKCNLCGQKFGYEPLNLDHIIPLSRGGKDVLANLALVHVRCNQQKGNRTNIEMRQGVSKAVAQAAVGP